MSADVFIIGFYHLLLIWLVLYALHRFRLIRLVRRTVPSAEPPAPREWPAVLVQLPVYNEAAVIRRLMRAVGSLDYPGSVEIQILDDSSDESSMIIQQELEALGDPRIVHLRRDSRDGFKAGALAYGLALSDAPLVAIFDSDFVPHPDFLMRMMPHLLRPGIGMVQARWEHLNRDESMLTRLQALYLDAHFAVESAARYGSGLFFNFNGTAGIWRREAIEQAGGWSSATVTEDLDLSYRAQQKGWRFVFVSEVEVPAELPSTLTSFHGQQFRWAKGSLQTARRRLPSLLAGDLPWRVKLEALVHLSNNLAYLLTLVLALLLVPAMIIRYEWQASSLLLVDALLFGASTASLVSFYREGQRRCGRTMPRPSELIWLVPFGIGLSVTNAAAAVEGLTQRGGVFQRTLKTGGVVRARGSADWSRMPWIEAALAIYFVASGAVMISAGMVLPLPFLALFSLGYGSTAWMALRERFGVRWEQSRIPLSDLGCWRAGCSCYCD